jgi:cutinase
MASEIAALYKACPSTKAIVSGYSQGGQLVHNAIALLPAATAAWISKVVMFGDPCMLSSIPSCWYRLTILLR